MRDVDQPVVAQVQHNQMRHAIEGARCNRGEGEPRQREELAPGVPAQAPAGPGEHARRRVHGKGALGSAAQIRLQDPVSNTQHHMSKGVMNMCA